VINSDRTLAVRFVTVWLKQRHVGKCKSMVFVIIGQESQTCALVLDLGTENGLVPIQHLFETACAVNDVSELCRSN
jgi:hypothetical protein